MLLQRAIIIRLTDAKTKGEAKEDENDVFDIVLGAKLEVHPQSVEKIWSDAQSNCVTISSYQKHFGSRERL